MDDLTQLALAAGDGDRAALERFVQVAQPDVWRLCSHLVGGNQADDLCQEAFVRAIGGLGRFRGDSSARTWLMSITRHTCIDSIRATQRRRGLAARLSSHPQESSPSREGEVELDALLSSLEQDRRVAFVLTQLIGLSYQDAAEVCDCPIGTIRSRVARARADLLVAVEPRKDRRSAGE